MIWTLLSVKTLNQVKFELMMYVQDVVKDMSNRDTRAHLTETLNQLNEIDDAIEALGGTVK